MVEMESLRGEEEEGVISSPFGVLLVGHARRNEWGKKELSQLALEVAGKSKTKEMKGEWADLRQLVSSGPHYTKTLG